MEENRHNIRHNIRGKVVKEPSEEPSKKPLKKPLKNIFARAISVVLTAILVLSAFMCGLCGCGAKKVKYDKDVETVTFVDSCNREVEVPKEVTRVAPSGALATMFLAVVCPEYMVCISSTPSSSQYKFLDSSIIKLPTTGQLYGSKSTINLETLMAAEPQVIIDLGDRKEGINHDMTSLQNQSGIATVYIESDLPHMANAFRMLGKLLSGKEEKCEELAQYVEETVSLAEQNREKISEDDMISVAYGTGTSGLAMNAAESTQAQVIDFIGAKNAVVVDDVSNKGGGNNINMEQLYIFDPDVIIFSKGSMYDKCADDKAWNQLRAVKNDDYYEIPSSPYNWMGSPPSLNMLLGIRWLGNLLYPDLYQLDMAAEAKRYYKLMWNYDLSDEEITDMLSKSTYKK